MKILRKENMNEVLSTNELDAIIADERNLVLVFISL